MKTKVSITFARSLLILSTVFFFMPIGSTQVFGAKKSSGFSGGTRKADLYFTRTSENLFYSDVFPAFACFKSARIADVFARQLALRPFITFDFQQRVQEVFALTLNESPKFTEELLEKTMDLDVRLKRTVSIRSLSSILKPEQLKQRDPNEECLQVYLGRKIIKTNGHSYYEINKTLFEKADEVDRTLLLVTEVLARNSSGGSGDLKLLPAGPHPFSIRKETRPNRSRQTIVK